MKRAVSAFVILLIGLPICFTLYAQNRGTDIVVEEPSTVLCERDSLKVFGTDGFPKDLSCRIQIGGDPYPYLDTEGKSGQVTFASIHMKPGRCVSITRSAEDPGPFVLYLFTEDIDGKVLSFFDLNFDGEWDIKKTTGEKRNLISLEHEWMDVDVIEGIGSASPRARKGENQYEFTDSWVKQTGGIKADAGQF